MTTLAAIGSQTCYKVEFEIKIGILHSMELWLGENELEKVEG